MSSREYVLADDKATRPETVRQNPWEMNEMTEISAMYEALDNMDDYALMANVKPIGPHKVLTDAIAELEQLRQRVAELEKERDKAAQYWQIAEGRCDALKQQIDALVEAAIMAVEMIEYNKHERRHVRWQLNDAIASVKEKS